MRKAVFPGSFDPITLGHVDIIRRGLPLFDELVVAIGVNSAKKYHFSLEKRLEFISSIFENDDKLHVQTYEGLTVDYCRSINAGFILRGIRSSSDFEFERNIAQLNSTLNGGVESVFLISAPQFSHISSTIVREILKYGGDVSDFLPGNVVQEL